MSGVANPYVLTDPEIAAVISAGTIAGVYDPNGHLTDAGIAAVLSAATVGAKMAGLLPTDVGTYGLFECSFNATTGTAYAGSSITAAGLHGTNATATVVDAGTSPPGTWMPTTFALGVSGTTSGLCIWQRVA